MITLDLERRRVIDTMTGGVVSFRHLVELLGTHGTIERLFETPDAREEVS